MAGSTRTKLCSATRARVPLLPAVVRCSSSSVGWCKNKLTSGFAAAFVIMLFPRPLSSKRMVRRSLARGIADLADLYSREVTGFILENEDDDAAIDVLGRQLRYRAKFFAIFVSCCTSALTAGQTERCDDADGLCKVSASMATLTLGWNRAFGMSNGNLADNRGAWPAAKYAKLHHAEMRILSTCAILSGAYARLSPKYCKILVRHSPFLNPNFVSARANKLTPGRRLDAAALSPSPLFAERDASATDHFASRASDLLRASLAWPVAHPGDARRRLAHGCRSAGSQLERAACEWSFGCADQNDQTALYATATVALSHLANAMNELQSLVISLVGETEMSGFDQIQLERGHRDVERFVHS